MLLAEIAIGKLTAFTMLTLQKDGNSHLNQVHPYFMALSSTLSSPLLKRFSTSTQAPDLFHSIFHVYFVNVYL